MPRARASLLVVTTAVGVAVVACAPAAPQVTAHSAILPLSGSCPPDASGGAEFTTEVQSLKLTVTAKDMPAPVKSTGDLGSALQIADVPAGTDRSVGLFGLVGAGIKWRGVATGVEVKPNEDTPVDILMARLGDLSCARGSDDDKRAFHTATVLDDGKILLVGGANSGTDNSVTCGAGCHKLTATASASLFDPGTGQFIPLPPLQHARLFHVAAKLADGRVIIAGGAEGALVRPIDTAHPFPIEPVTPVKTIEVFDPAARTFSAIGDDPNGPRVFAAAAPTDDGSVIITGGVPGVGSPRNDLGNALDSTTVCNSALSCGNGPTMQTQRAGHMAFLIPGDGVFLWGGSINTDANRFSIENIKGVSTLLEVNKLSSNFRNPFFAAMSQYLDFRVLAAGGLIRDPDGSFRPAEARECKINAPDPDGATCRASPLGTAGAVYIYSEKDGGVFGGIVTGHPPNDTPMHLAGPRFFAAAAALPGGTRAIIAGGFTDLDTFTPTNDLELFDQGSLTVVVPSANGIPITLRDPRGGLVAAANGDGAVLLSGGEIGPSSAPQTRIPSGTAEIFADTLTPPGVAE